jgi:UDP-N-acetyl-2-amino-2-deoxyglucuronate dehydrogenase
MKHFALVGASGYIAPRHMKAIRETGNDLVVALDPYDGIGIMDSNFPQADFFTEHELFDGFVDQYNRDNHLDYYSICTPNYLHESYIRYGLQHGGDVICEKPLVLDPEAIDRLKVIENETGHKTYNILQLRLHDSIAKLKTKIQQELRDDPDRRYNIDLTYLTSRGKWYFTSWKGDETKSGGLASNIGVHFYDMLTWIFGEVEENIVHLKTPDASAGTFRLKHADVRWFLSVNYDYIPEEIKATGQRTYRSITVDSEEIEFSGGFTDLHTRSYEKILSGNGFGLDEAYGSIRTVADIRHQTPIGLKGEYHPYCKKVIG